MLDGDPAELYGVTTARLNEQGRRNKERFPKDFGLQLTREEFEVLIWLWAWNFQKEHKRAPTPREREIQQDELITAIPTDEEKYKEIFSKSLKTTEKFNF